jgi:hypothetical protein
MGSAPHCQALARPLVLSSRAHGTGVRAARAAVLAGCRDSAPAEVFLDLRSPNASSNNDLTASDRLSKRAGRGDRAEDHVAGVRDPVNAELARDLESAGGSDMQVTDLRHRAAVARCRQSRSDARASGASVQRAGSDENAVTVDRLAADSRGELFLNCPRCGLRITPGTAWLSVRHCPRCLARSRTATRHPVSQAKDGAGVA